MRSNICIFSLILLSCTFFSCKKRFHGDWIAKIDGNTVTLDELNTFYYAQQKSLYNITKEEIDKLALDPAAIEKNPTLNKQEFLEQLIRQRLVYNKAVEDDILKNMEVEALAQMAKEAVVVGYYVREKFNDEIAVNDDEVEKIYSSKRSKFKGVPIEQAELYIRQQLFQQKLQMKIRELVENLREQSRIEKNAMLLSEGEGQEVIESNKSSAEKTK